MSKARGVTHLAPAPHSSRLEGNVVVEFPGHGGSGLLGSGAAGIIRRLVLIEVVVARGTGTAARAQHLHVVGDNFGGIAIMPVLVLPLARLQASFDIDLRALLQIFTGDFRQTPEKHDAMPFGFLLLFAAGLVLP